jgi:hypothetical protein
MPMALRTSAERSGWVRGCTSSVPPSVTARSRLTSPQGSRCTRWNGPTDHSPRRDVSSGTSMGASPPWSPEPSSMSATGCAGSPTARRTIAPTRSRGQRGGRRACTTRIESARPRRRRRHAAQDLSTAARAPRRQHQRGDLGPTSATTAPGPTPAARPRRVICAVPWRGGDGGDGLRDGPPCRRRSTTARAATGGRARLGEGAHVGGHTPFAVEWRGPRSAVVPAPRAAGPRRSCGIERVR